MPVFKYEQSDKEKAASKRGRRSREKGGRFEKAMENYHNEAYKRNDVNASAQRGFKSEKDVETIDNNTGRIVFNKECRRWKKVSWKAAWKMALSKQRAGSIPMAICKDDYDEEIMILRLRDGIEMECAWLKQQTKEG